MDLGFRILLNTFFKHNQTLTSHNKQTTASTLSRSSTRENHQNESIESFETMMIKFEEELKLIKGRFQ